MLPRSQTKFLHVSFTPRYIVCEAAAAAARVATSHIIPRHTRRVFLALFFTCVYELFSPHATRGALVRALPSVQHVHDILLLPSLASRVGGGGEPIERGELSALYGGDGPARHVVHTHEALGLEYLFRSVRSVLTTTCVYVVRVARAGRRNRGTENRTNECADLGSFSLITRARSHLTLA